MVFCLVHLANASAWAEGTRQEAKRVLILHSYHTGLPWTDEIMSGMKAVLANSNRLINIDVEYLDTKRHNDPNYFSHVLDAILHYKFKDRKYDLVLLSGNEALKFALEHRNNLLRSTPIIFCGINCDNEAVVASTPQITGVRADPDFAGVIRQALLLHPKTKELVVIGSTKDLSDRINLDQLESSLSEFTGRVHFNFWNDLPAEKLASQLTGLREGAIVLINGSIRDRHDNLLSFNEQNILLRKSTRVPMYSFWGVYLGQGIVGGPLINARSLGLQAAGVALRILSGVPAASIPIAVATMDGPVFDYKELKRFGVSLHQLPDKYRLVNAPPSSYQINKSQFWLAAATLFGLLGITIILTRNILRRKRAEAMLRQSEQVYKELSQQFQIILDGIPDSLTLISPEMKVIWSNSGVDADHNKTLGHIPGDYCCKLLYNRISLCDNCPAVNAFQSKKNEEAIITTPDNRILEVKAFPVKTGSGEISHVIMLASDITEKNKLIEESIRNGRLASLGELAAGVAHEINNPNALVLLNAELVRKACGDAAPILREHYEQNGEFMLAGFPYSEMREELPHLFAEMFESAGRIKRIVCDLKNFAMPDGPIMMEMIDLNDAVRASLRLAGNTIKNSTDNLSIDLAETLPLFHGNLQRIEQVVLNLIINACQALDDKSRSVRISTYYHAERRACVIKVQDEGCGISKENILHITDPFFTTKRNSGGTGLGLSVSMRIIKDYAGDIEFISELNKGTIASIYLPVSQEGALT